jgi:alkylation response protein AidB-like acyl-CoA dehydrogenase
MIDLRQGGGDIVAADALDLDRVYADVLLSDAPVIALAAGEWRSLADAGAILRAADMMGAAEASFADACAHVSTRRQFGKPLSAQQVISTTLARDHFSLTGAALSVEYAALAADVAQEDASNARDVACSVAQDACITAAENAIQFHGALGFTAAMPLHRRLRRIQTAADIYNAKTARANLARTLLESWPDPYKDAA